MYVACKEINSLSAVATFSNGVIKIGVMFFLPVNSIPSRVMSIFALANLKFKKMPSLGALLSKFWCRK